jgi:hypothetical protein
MLIFRAVTLWGLVSGYQRFGGKFCFHVHNFNPEDAES